MLELEDAPGLLPGSGFEALPPRWRADRLVCLRRHHLTGARVAGDDDGIVILSPTPNGSNVNGYGERAVQVLAGLAEAGALRGKLSWLDLPRAVTVPTSLCRALAVRPNPGWDFLSTTTPPPTPSEVVEELDLGTHLDEIRACLVEANPTTDADPTHPDEVGWWGIREQGQLLGVLGANRRGGDDDTSVSWHLHGLGVRPTARKRGLGAALTSAVTRLGLSAGAPWVCLGAWAENVAALRLYHRLGFHTDHERRSYGPVSGPHG